MHYTKSGNPCVRGQLYSYDGEQFEEVVHRDVPRIAVAHSALNAAKKLRFWVHQHLRRRPQLTSVASAALLTAQVTPELVACVRRLEEGGLRDGAETELLDLIRVYQAAAASGLLDRD